MKTLDIKHATAVVNSDPNHRMWCMVDGARRGDTVIAAVYCVDGLPS